MSSNPHVDLSGVITDPPIGTYVDKVPLFRYKISVLNHWITDIEVWYDVITFYMKDRFAYCSPTDEGHIPYDIAVLGASSVLARTVTHNCGEGTYALRSEMDEHVMRTEFLHPIGEKGPHQHYAYSKPVTPQIFNCVVDHIVQCQQQLEIRQQVLEETARYQQAITFYKRRCPARFEEFKSSLDDPLIPPTQLNAIKTAYAQFHREHKDNLHYQQVLAEKAANSNKLYQAFTSSFLNAFGLQFFSDMLQRASRLDDQQMSSIRETLQFAYIVYTSHDDSWQMTYLLSKTIQLLVNLCNAQVGERISLLTSVIFSVSFSLLQQDDNALIPMSRNETIGTWVLSTVASSLGSVAATGVVNLLNCGYRYFFPLPRSENTVNVSPQAAQLTVNPGS